MKFLKHLSSSGYWGWHSIYFSYYLNSLLIQVTLIECSDLKLLFSAHFKYLSVWFEDWPFVIPHGSNIMSASWSKNHPKIWEISRKTIVNVQQECQTCVQSGSLGDLTKCENCSGVINYRHYRYDTTPAVVMAAVRHHSENIWKVKIISRMM